VNHLKDISGTLYFIALIPGWELREKVRAVKERMKADFKSGHALKSPAHITLQMPFKRNSTGELAISDTLEQFAAREASFTVDLDGFGCFAPRVIFIRITNPEPVIALHRRLKKVLLEELDFPGSEIMKTVQPHITVATRDLTREAFAEAWPGFQDEEFKGSFNANSLFLLKHNGRDWDILKEFPFKSNG
jgi:2'-5' RNA ligase